MKKRWKICLVLLTMAFAGLAGFFVYASDYRTLEEEFHYILEESPVNHSSRLSPFTNYIICVFSK